MNAYRYKKIDAFAAGRSTGNPAACFFLGDGDSLSDTDMLAIAKQHAGFVSEVVYCAGNGGKPYELRYFSSECEVAFCGHGTIACMYSLIRNTPELLREKSVVIHTPQKGPLTVYNDIAGQDAVFITAPGVQYLDAPAESGAIAEALSLSPAQLDERYPIDCIDAGLRTLIVPVRRLADEVSVFPNERGLKDFCIACGVDIILIYSLKTGNPGFAAHTRVFAPRFGYLEDPATGSGNSAFGWYLAKNGLWAGETIAIEQGGTDRVFNTVKLTQRDGGVLFGGGAVDRIVGNYYY